MYAQESVAVVVVANVVIVFQLLVSVADVRFFKPVLNLLAQLYSLFLTSASRALQNDVTKSGWERALNEGTSTVIRYTYHAYSHVRTSFTQKLSSLISVDFFKPALRCFYNIFQCQIWRSSAWRQNHGMCLLNFQVTCIRRVFICTSPKIFSNKIAI